MSKFIRHIPCPKCGSRDNCGEYTDHYYCFGCKFWKSKDDIASVRERVFSRSSQKITEDSIDIDVVQDIPKEALRWILSYGITMQEIEDCHFGWNEQQQLLVLLNLPGYWQARCFGNQRVKYLSKGTKPLTFYGMADKLVCVEDILSAIKISRLSPEWCALPLLGCSMPENFTQQLAGRFKEIVIWLDRDKAKNALVIAKNLKQKGFNSRVVISPLDPKEYSKGEIKNYLTN